MLKIKHLASKMAIFFHLIIFVFACYFAWSHYVENIKDANIKVENRLTLESNIKKELLDKFYITASTEIVFWAENGSLKLGLDTLKTTWSELGNSVSKQLRKVYIDDNPFKNKEEFVVSKNGTNYDILHQAMHEFLYDLQKTRGYADIYLLDLNGNVLYSVKKKRAFAQNISKAQNNLSEVFNECKASDKKEFVSFRDFKKEDSSFLATSVSDEDGEKIGVLVFEFSKDSITKITPLNQINKEECKTRFEKKSEYFTAFTCTKFKDNYWGIKTSKKIEEIYKPIKEEFFDELVIYISIAIFSLSLSYLILEKLLGRKEEDDE